MFFLREKSDNVAFGLSFRVTNILAPTIPSMRHIEITSEQLRVSVNTTMRTFARNDKGEI
jgi:hypothetical protein